ncbi:MAG: FeoA family protein [Planctomycetota bacterium]|nr:FeoA family protein [Planctomycetota bacterium]
MRPERTTQQELTVKAASHHIASHHITSHEIASHEIASNVRSLFDLRKGERGRLVADSVPEAQRPLFEAMGMCHDCELRVCHNTGSCVFEVAGQRVGLSKEVATAIRVLPVQS